MTFAVVPLVLQGIAMFVDEFWFHRRRGLPRWERIGHPLDTITVLAVFAYLLWGTMNLSLYIGMCAFSCLFITKDEFVHAKKCDPQEHWLHAFLFMLHPAVFLSAYHLWQIKQLNIVRIQFTIVAVFLVYQILRWSVSWQESAT